MASETVTVAAEAEDSLSSLKTQFLASLNHEVRTPLTGILGMIDLLLETPLDDEQKDYVTTVRLCADDLLALFNKTLEFSDLSSGRCELTRQEFHLPETLRNAVMEHAENARGKQIKLVCRLAPDLPEVAVGDAVRLRQVVSYVVENGVKFTEQGKVEVLGTGRFDDGRFVLKLKVTDTGIGIPADKLLAVFESFRQLDSGLARSYPGLGLGLPLVQKVTMLMGGDLAVESEPGRGSVFSVTIPLELAGGATPTPDSAELAPVPSQRQILLVEDNEVARRVVTHILSRGDYAACCASSGEEAIEAASRRQFDLVLMDLQMPGMDGFQTTAKLRDLPGYATTPIIALTANVTEEHRRMSLNAGMQAFVPKPVQPEELLDAVARALQ